MKAVYIVHCKKLWRLTDTKYLYIEHVVGIGTPPTPLPLASVPPPPGPKGGAGGHTRLRLRGWGSSNSDEKKLSTLHTLCLHILHICRFWNCSIDGNSIEPPPPPPPHPYLPLSLLNVPECAADTYWSHTVLLS